MAMTPNSGLGEGTTAGQARRAISGLAGAGYALFVGAAFVVVAVVALIGVLLGSGCALTERVVDREIISSPEMAFDDLDLDRDLPGGDLGGGGGGGGGGGC
jgi:hypothetical protein